MRDALGRFVKGVPSGKKGQPTQKSRICRMCYRGYICNNYSQKYCGSTLARTGCAWKNKNKPKPKVGHKRKICVDCHKEYLPTGNNQRRCGSRTKHYTCAWYYFHKKPKKSFAWLKRMKVKI